MDNKRNSAFALLWLYMIFSTIIAYLERSAIAPNDLVFYMCGKLAIVWMTLPVAFILRRDPRSMLGNSLAGFSLAVYPAFCGWYRINYEYAVFELMLAYALAFRPTRTLFVVVCVFCVGLFSAVRIYRFDFLRPQFANPMPADGVFTTSAMGAVAIIIFFYLNYERRWREAALTRFGLIGQHSSNIIHDVKNLIASPAVYASTLKRKLAHYDDPEVQEIVSEIQISLSRTSRLIFDLNEMSRLAEQKLEIFSVRDLVKQVIDLLDGHLRGIDIQVTGDLEIAGDRALLYSIFVSVFMNAADQFGFHRVEKPEIKVELEPRLCRVSDNGGGFADTVLRDLNARRQPRTTKKTGSGVGLYLATSAMIEMGGSASFWNSKTGAVVELRF